MEKSPLWAAMPSLLIVAQRRAAHSSFLTSALVSMPCRLFHGVAEVE